jgi:hypothetical protein
MDGNTVPTDPGLIARRLGVTEELVRRLQARGVLRSFDLGESEVRARLYEAQVQRSTTLTDRRKLERR